ncbi:MAG: endo alpha-1,4 polygalactosaminidase [Bacteriovoracaceae bacterium]
MKSIFLLGLFIIFLIACDPSTPANSTTNLAPHLQDAVLGNVSNTNIATLGFQDLKRSQDQFEKYVELSPASLQLEVVYIFRVAATAVNNTTDFSLVINYKGPTFENDQWSFEIMRPGSTVWEQIGNNSAAKDWKWTFFSFKLGKMDTVFAADGTAKLRVKAISGKDNIDLDLFALNYQGVIPTPTPTVTPTVTPPPGSWWQPTIGTKWDIQFANAVVVKPEIQIYDLDLFDNTPQFIASLHALGKKVICYFSAGSSENWRPDFSQFPASVLGKKLSGWDGERWLDVRQIEILRPIMVNRIAQAKQKGCDAVDPDNVDGYTNSTGFPITGEQQLTYNRMLAFEAHKLGLSIGLKNDLNQINELVDVFDFSVNEECFDFNECSMLSPFIAKGKPVFGIQYSLDASVFCPKAKALNMDFIKKKQELDDWSEPCWNF